MATVSMLAGHMLSLWCGVCGVLRFCLHSKLCVEVRCACILNCVHCVCVCAEVVFALCVAC